MLLLISLRLYTPQGQRLREINIIQGILCRTGPHANFHQQITILAIY